MDILLGTEMQDRYIELTMKCDYIENCPTVLLDMINKKLEQI